MSEKIDFGELGGDEKFKAAVQNFEEVLNKIDVSLTTATEFKDIDELDAAEKVNLLNYLAYATNSLFWMNLKLHGEDTNEHAISNELSRVRQTILREKQIHDLKLKPTVNKKVANRFVRHELNIPRDKPVDAKNVE